jgi:hypothetical protein
MSKSTIGWVIGIFILFPIFAFLYNKITVSKNDGERYFASYYNKMVPVKLTIPESDPNNKNLIQSDFSSYRKGADPIGFKGTAGDIQYVTFYDQTYKKYFRIVLIDVNYQKYSNIMTDLMKKTINAYVNQDDFKNPKYGTTENPILIFNFKGVGGKIEIGSIDKNNNPIIESLELTNEQYKHNLITYLTYVMPKDKFKERFEEGK